MMLRKIVPNLLLLPLLCFFFTFLWEAVLLREPKTSQVTLLYKSSGIYIYHLGGRRGINQEKKHFGRCRGSLLLNDIYL